MAPELYGITDEGGSGLCTYKSDAFALGMVTFEVRDACRRILPHGFDTPYILSFRCSPDKYRSQIIKHRQQS